jgi:hypothetical protein
MMVVLPDFVRQAEPQHGLRLRNADTRIYLIIFTPLRKCLILSGSFHIDEVAGAFIPHLRVFSLCYSEILLRKYFVGTELHSFSAQLRREG